MPADGDVHRVENLHLPGGYDPLLHEIWMDERWCRALEEFAADPAGQRLKAIAFHALVHEHIHVNSPINHDLRDLGFLDLAQTLIEEACVDALAWRITERMLGHALPGRACGPSVETLSWLESRTGRDVAFDIWREPTLAARIRLTSDCIAAALRIPPQRWDDPAWLTRLRRLLAHEHGDLFLLLDAPDVVRQTADEIAGSQTRRPLARRLMARGGPQVLAAFAETLADRRTRRARALRRTLRGSSKF
jgi:hypothetical protein